MASIARLAATPEEKARASARNLLPGIVTAIVHGPVNAEVGLLVNDRLVIDALVSNAALDALDLRPGGRAIAMIKANMVALLDIAPRLRISERNLLGGTVVEITEGDIVTEVVLDIGGGRQLAAVVTTRSARDMGLAPGVEALACFKASHIILAVED